MVKLEPNKLNVFKQVYLSEGDRLVEMMCSVIIVLVMIGYLRLVLIQEGDEDYQKTIILMPLGAIAAWGIIDGIMYVLLNLIERGRLSRFFRALKRFKDNKEALDLIKDTLDTTVVGSLKEEDRKRIYDEIMRMADNASIVKPQWVTKRDLRVVLFTFLVVFFTGFVVLVPFIIVSDPISAIRISYIVGIALLFCIGYWWGKYASRSKIRSAVGMVLLGIAIVALTIVLGG